MTELCQRFDLHTHTTFSDGENEAEEMIRAAIGKGMTAIGISDHSYTSFDKQYCMKKEEAGRERTCLRELQAKYEGRIKVLVGIEQDLYSDTAPSAREYDYAIGSAHYLRFGDEFIPVDDTPEILRTAADKHCGGDLIALAEVYFRTVEELAPLAAEKKITFFGHFDLIRKFNRGGALFDEKDPRYVAAAHKALDTLLTTGLPFEINSGAVSRGYQDDPYPSADMLAYIKEHGGRLLLSSDAHAAQNIGYEFEKWQPLLGNGSVDYRACLFD